jgi:transcriptional antiterminator
MLYFKNRQIEIIQDLIYRNDKYTVEYLSNKYNVTCRTILKDLDIIEKWAYDNNILLNRDYKNGISLDYGNNQSKLIIKNQLSKTTIILNRKQRQSLIILYLLNSNDSMTIKSLSNMLDFSYSTIVNDLKDIDVLVNKFNIRLIKRQNYGLKIVGSENNIRKAILRLIMSNISIQHLFEIIYKNSNKYSLYNQFLETTFNIYELCETSKLLMKALNKYDSIFSDYGYIIASVNLTIVIKRIRNGFILKDNSINTSKEEIYKKKEYLITKEVINLIKNKYDIGLNENETLELSLDFLSTHGFNKDLEEYDDYYSKLDIVNTVKELFAKFKVFYGMDFSTNIEFLMTLCSHLETTVYAMENNRFIFNPLVDDIKNRYPYMFHFCSIICNKINKKNKQYILLNEEEIAYITIYFQMAIENFSKDQVNFPKILLVCGNINSITSYLESKIKKIFQETEIVGPISWGQVDDEKIDMSSIDLIISTVPIKLQNKKVCMISHFLTKRDIEEVNMELRNSIRRKVDFIDKEYELMLKDVIKKERIKLKIEVDDWESAIKEGGKLLLDSGGVNENYIKEMINAVKDMGAYIVIAPGIAIAHARPEDGVNFTCFSLITLKNPINFGNPDNDPVKLVLSFATENSRVHINALGEIMEVLSNEKNQKTIINSNDVNEVYKILIDTFK